MIDKIIYIINRIKADNFLCVLSRSFDFFPFDPSAISFLHVSPLSQHLLRLFIMNEHRKNRERERERMLKPYTHLVWDCQRKSWEPSTIKLADVVAVVVVVVHPVLCYTICLVHHYLVVHKIIILSFVTERVCSLLLLLLLSSSSFVHDLRWILIKENNDDDKIVWLLYALHHNQIKSSSLFLVLVCPWVTIWVVVDKQH